MKRNDNTSRKENYLFGRWTASECQRFLKGYENCGRNWMEVQKYVKTRNLSQIRSHAQKIFLKREDHGLDPESVLENSGEISYKDFSDDENEFVERLKNKRSISKPPKLLKKEEEMKKSKENYEEEVTTCGAKIENDDEEKKNSFLLLSSSLPSQEQLSKYISESSSPSHFMQMIELMREYFERGGSFLELSQVSPLNK